MVVIGQIGVAKIWDTQLVRQRGLNEGFIVISWEVVSSASEIRSNSMNSKGDSKGEGYNAAR